MSELTKKQLERQDLVDNAIHAMLREVMAYKFPERDLGWDIRVISDIREAITKEYCRQLGESMEFYPWDEEKPIKVDDLFEEDDDWMNYPRVPEEDEDEE